MDPYERTQKIIPNAQEALFAEGLIYSRQIGNAYSASLYLALISLLENAPDLSNKRLACFSYGSGAVSEFFALKVQQGYQSALFTEQHQQLLQQREALNYQEYLQFWHGEALPNKTSSAPRFCGEIDNKRVYRA